MAMPETTRDLLLRLFRLVLLVFSVVGWLVFLIGFAVLHKRLDSKINTDDYESTRKNIKTFASAFYLPMLLFMVSSVFTYTALGLHTVIMARQNATHVLHCLFMVFNLFYVAGGGTVVFLVTGYILLAENKHLNSFVESILPFDIESIKVVRAGVVVALIFYWLATSLWRLLKVKKRRPGQFQELIETQ